MFICIYVCECVCPCVWINAWATRQYHFLLNFRMQSPVLQHMNTVQEPLSWRRQASRSSRGAKANGAEAPCKLRPASLNLHLEPKLART